MVRYAVVFEAGTNRWLFTWTPWYTTMHLPEGVAYTVKAGTKLAVEIGYHGTEAATTDTSEVGLYFEKSGAAVPPRCCRCRAPPPTWRRTASR